MFADYLGGGGLYRGLPKMFWTTCDVVYGTDNVGVAGGGGDG